MRSSLFLTIGLGLLSACATSSRQTEALLKAPGDLPRTAHVSNVPFIEQSKDFCGPATLTMAMNWAGNPVSIDALGVQTFTPGKSGTLQADLLSASRRNGMLAVPVQGMPALLKEIAAGHPVIVLQNLAFSWYPKWHYAIAHGYDLGERDLHLHSGPDANKKLDLKKFEASWALGKYWGLVVLPPTQLSVSADDLAHTAAAAGLEQLGKLREAESIYRNVLGRWPSSLGALIGIGNTRYAAQDYRAAAKYLGLATEKHADSANAWHNLAVAQGAAGQRAKARKSAARAIALAGDGATADKFRVSLGAWL